MIATSHTVRASWRVQWSSTRILRRGMIVCEEAQTRRYRAMVSRKEKYIVNEHGERVSVLLDIDDYRRLLEELEELESIRAYDAAKPSDDEIIPFEQAAEEIERSRE
jgi:prevent-host-death family protein